MGRDFAIDALDFAKGDGFVTVVCQDAQSGTVLMVARADREAMEQTVATGEMHYHSRTRGLWHKGATSGNVQRVVSLASDCDGDVVLAQVAPAGPACHTGAVSCFHSRDVVAARGAPPAREFTVESAGERHHSDAPQIIPTPASVSPNQAAPSPEPLDAAPTTDRDAALGVLERLAQIVEQRQYATQDQPNEKPSYTRRLLVDRNLRLKKLGEEAAELVIACADGDRARVAEEGADLFYHAIVALIGAGVRLDDVARVLGARER